MKSFTKKALGLCVMSAIAAGNSYAALEEIVVTASKREQAITDVPFSISAIGGEDLENKGIVDISGLSREIPSVTLNQGFSTTASVISIRGIDSFSGNDPTTAFYLDDFAYSVPGFAFAPPLNLYDLERVEVLRGPQGTLYGASAMGGLVRLITADPDASAGFYGKAQVSYSKITDGDNTSGGDIALNIPLIEDVLAARLVASYKDIGGFIDRPDADGGSDANASEVQSYRAKLKYTPDDQLVMKLAVWHTEDDSPYGTLVTSAEDRENVSGFESTFTAEQTITNFALSYEFDGFTLENAITYAEYEQTQLFNVPGAFFSSAVYTSDVLTEELRLVSNGDGPFKWLGGVFYRASDFEGPLVFNTTGLFDSFEDTKAETEEVAIFGEVSYTFMDDALEVLLGFRYSEEEREYDTRFTQVAGPFAFLFGITDEDISVQPSDTFETFNPRFNVTWRPNDDAQVYFNLAKGYRPGKLNNVASAGLAPGAGLSGDFLLVKDDQIYTAEVGTKASLFDGRVALEASVYYSEWEDAQFSVSVSAFNSVTANVGDQQLLGADLSLTFETGIEGLTGNFTTTFNRGEWDSINDPGVTAIDPRFAKGAAIESIPDKTVNFKLDYVTPINDSLNLLASGSYYYRDEQADIASTSVAPVQQVANFQVAVESPDDWVATLFINNAFNYDKIATFTTGALTQIIQPREIGLRVQKHF